MAELEKFSFNKETQDNDKELESVITGYEEAAVIELHNDGNEEEIEESKEPIKDLDVTAEEPTAPVSIPASSVISGAMLLTFIDLVIPRAIMLLHNNLVPKGKKKIKTITQLRLSKSDLKELSPLADEVAALIKVEGNPYVMLSFSVISIYAFKYYVLTND